MDAGVIQGMRDELRKLEELARKYKAEATGLRRALEVLDGKLRTRPAKVEAGKAGG